MILSNIRRKLAVTESVLCLSLLLKKSISPRVDCTQDEISDYLKSRFGLNGKKWIDNALVYLADELNEVKLFNHFKFCIEDPLSIEDPLFPLGET